LTDADKLFILTQDKCGIVWSRMELYFCFIPCLLWQVEVLTSKML